MKPPLRVGVVGAAPYGFGARAHLPGIQLTSGVELVAVCTAHDQTAQEAALRWKAPRWYGDINDLVADPEVDLITIAVKPRSHYSLCRIALDAGKMVYCEWPLALNTEQAQEMTDLAESRSIMTGVGLQGRWSPELRYMKQLVASGQIGKPLTFQVRQMLPSFEVTAARAWLAQESEASGALFVATAHVLDAVRFVLCAPQALVGIRDILSPEDAFSDSGESFTWEASDTVMGLVRLSEGMLGTVGVSNITDPSAGFTLLVAGDEGVLRASAPGYFQFTPMTLELGKKGGNMEAVHPPKALLEGVPGDGPGANVGRALAAFSQAASQGVRFEPDFRQGLEMHKIIDSLIRSSDQGRWVNI